MVMSHACWSSSSSSSSSLYVIDVLVGVRTPIPPTSIRHPSKDSSSRLDDQRHLNPFDPPKSPTNNLAGWLTGWLTNLPHRQQHAIPAQQPRVAHGRGTDPPPLH